MIDHPPPLPQGKSAFKNWCRWVQESIIRLRTNEGPDVLVDRTTRGVQMRPKGGSNTGASQQCPFA